MTGSPPPFHAHFYSKALFYDIAFDFKKVDQENQSLLSIFKKHRNRDPESFLDIAAGPATNAIEMAARGLRALALDFSPEMVAYGLAKAARQGREIFYLQTDMRRFEAPFKVDLAAIFMDSTSYLLTNDDVISHLRSVARALNPDGIYVLEMSHPRDVFRVGRSASTEWTMARGDLEITVQWGADTDEFDPITQLTRVTATLKYASPEKCGEIIDRSDQRCFTFQEFEALVRASGVFDLVETLGSLTPKFEFSGDQKSWRMIPVLRRRDESDWPESFE